MLCSSQLGTVMLCTPILVSHLSVNSERMNWLSKIPYQYWKLHSKDTCHPNLQKWNNCLSEWLHFKTYILFPRKMNFPSWGERKRQLWDLGGIFCAFRSLCREKIWFLVLGQFDSPLCLEALQAWNWRGRAVYDQGSQWTLFIYLELTDVKFPFYGSVQLINIINSALLGVL